MGQSYADLIFVNGEVLTQEDRGSASSVAVRDGLIVAVSDEALLDFRGTQTEVVDLDGATLLPGFVDAHAHPVAGGIARLQCDLSEVHSLERYREIIHEYAQTCHGQWVTGAGWYGDVFPGGYPTKNLLDDVVGGRPCVLTSHDAHSYWASTRALELSGIDRNTPDPAGGRIVRDPGGEPTGLIMENAMELVNRVLPPTTQSDLRAGLLEAQKYFHSLGITSWQDAAVGEIFGIPDAFETYLSAERDGDLVSRATLALRVLPDTFEQGFHQLVERRDRAHGRVQATAAKLFLDGNCENLTAAVHEAYAGHPTEYGLMQYTLDELETTVSALDDLEFDLHLHAVGDRAVSAAIDALSELQNISQSRHQIAHIDLVAPKDIERMRDLGIIANVSPIWARHDPVLVETKLPLLTENHKQRHFVYGSLDRGGIMVAFGSDWPVSTPDPIAGIHTAINRFAAPDDPHAADPRALTDPLLPTEGLTLSSALQSATRRAAIASGLDSHVGTITPGKEADLVVLNRSLTDVPRKEIGSVRVNDTFVFGHQVYSC